jgi:hypothetical protein
MKIQTLAAAAALALFGAAPAQAATMVAGWDFAQYFGAGFLSTDGATFTDTLSANYSNLDPTFNAGTESAQFGTMFIDGQHGSTAVAAGSGSEPFLPTSGSLGSNLTAPVLGGGLNPFDSHTILLSENPSGFASFLSMVATSTVSVVFSGDLTSVPQTGQGWSITFGGQTSQGTASITVEFSTDGTNYTSAGPALSLTTTDALFTVSFGSATSERAFVRLTIDPGSALDARIDNVALNVASLVAVPEPTTAALLLAGLVGLARFGRRRG